MNRLIYHDLIHTHKTRSKSYHYVYRDYDWPTNLLIDLHLSFNVNGRVYLYKNSEEDWIEPSPQILPRIVYILQATLTDREAEIIRLRYEKKLLYREIAEIFGFTPNNANQILDKALRKMRHPRRWNFLRYGHEDPRLYHEYNKGYNQGYKDAIRIQAEKNKPDATAAQITMTTACYRPIESLDISICAYNQLRRRGCETIHDILVMTQKDFARIYRSNQKEIIQALKKYEFSCSHLEQTIDTPHS